MNEIIEKQETNLDFDSFKSVNDHFGHSMGDKVLCTTVKQARRQLRKIDVISRLGRDEFAFLLPETDFGTTVRKSYCMFASNLTKEESNGR